MKNKFYTLPSKEDYEELISQLVHRSINPDEQVGYMGDFRMVDKPGRVSYIFGLNGATVIGSKDGGLIEMCVRDTEHAQNTKKLLSQLTGVPADKFFMV